MQAPAKETKRRSVSYAKWGYIFIAPFFIVFALFQLIPLGSTIYYSFFEYYRSGLKIIGPTFKGVDNYIKLLSLDLVRRGCRAPDEVLAKAHVGEPPYSSLYSIS